MSNAPLSAIILAAGRGSRMKSTKSKVLHEIGARPMLAHVIDTASALAPQALCVVVNAEGEEIASYAQSVNSAIAIAVQDPPQGTGDAVRQAEETLAKASGVVLVLYADTPLIAAETLRGLSRAISNGASVAVLGFRPPDPGSYGRLKTDTNGGLEAIVEARDASEDELAITLCNSGVLAFDATFLKTTIGTLSNENAKGEYYLTDLVAIARAQGKQCAIVEADADEVIGVNSRAELAAAEHIYQTKKRNDAMANGVTLIDPPSVFFSYDTDIANDVVIEPHVFFGPGVTVASGAHIKAYCHLEGATISAEAQIGPYSRLRPGAKIGEEARVGNFVEIKNTTLATGAKASHLTYLGDAEIGARANIGAGTITCNYDGYVKSKTIIGEDTFIGSNSALVAPVRVGDSAYVGSGSVITRDVGPGDLAVARGRQAIIEGWAARFHKANQRKGNDK